MSRHQRQLDELGDLCIRGAVERAIDLAFEHFAEFGADADIVTLLRDAIVSIGATEDVRRRFAELCGAPGTNRGTVA